MESTNTSKERIIFLDMLKVIAIFLMLANHCVDNVSPIERTEPWYQIWGSIYNTFTRPAIPLFVMVTGILLLPVNLSMGTFYKKKISRLIIPFLFWSLLYNALPHLFQLFGLDASTINLFYRWADPVQATTNASYNILMIPFQFSPFAVQMWYVYMLIGLYLYLPIFSAWVEKSDQKAQHLFLVIWFGSLFVPYLRCFLTENLWGVCSWNEFGLFYYFSGFSGYLLLGYHLNKYPLKLSKTNKYLIAFTCFAIGYMVTLTGFREMIANHSDSESMVELFFTFCSPNVALMSFALFVLLQDVNYKNRPFNKIITRISIATFGIWMCHFLFVGPIYKLIDQLECHTMTKLIIETFSVLLVSSIFVTLIRKLGKTGKKIMG